MWWLQADAIAGFLISLLVVAVTFWLLTCFLFRSCCRMASVYKVETGKGCTVRAMGGDGLASQRSSGTRSGYRFLLPSYKLPNIIVSEDRKSVQRRGRRAQSYVYFDSKLKNKIELVVERKGSPPEDGLFPGEWSITAGLTTCAPDRVCDQPHHAGTDCGQDCPCNGSSIRQPLGMGKQMAPGTVITIEKRSGNLTVSMRRALESAPTTFATKIPDDAMIYPFLLMDGVITEVRIREKDCFKFLQTSRYQSGGVTYMDEKCVRKADGRPAIVYLNQSLKRWDSIHIQIFRTSERSGLFTIGLTSCSLKTIESDARHALSPCGEGRGCVWGKANLFPVSESLKSGSKLCFERTDDSFFTSFEDRPVDAHWNVPDSDLHPFLVLDGSISEVRIINGNEFTEFNPAPTLRPLVHDRVSDSDSDSGSSSTPPPSMIRVPCSRARGDPPPRPSMLRFLVPSYASKCNFAMNDTNVVRVPGAKSCIAYFNRPLGCSGAEELVFAFPPETHNNFSKCTFQIGLTTCDPASILKHECHALETCSPYNPCRGNAIACNVVVPRKESFSVFVQRKSDGVVVIIIDFNVPNNEVFAWEEARSFASDRVTYPFIVLTGSLGKVMILNKSTEETAAHVKFGPHNDYMFLFPTYPADSIQISRREVRRIDPCGPCIAYFSDQLAEGNKLQLRIDEIADDGRTRKPWCLEFGVTTCYPDHISVTSCHADSLCRRTTCPEPAYVLTYGVTDKVKVGSVISFERNDDDFVEIMVDGKKYSMHDRKKLFVGKGPAMPFIALVGSASAVSIITGQVPKRDVSQQPKGAKTKNTVSKQKKESAPKEPIDFLVSWYANGNMLISEDKKQVSRKMGSGSCIVYLTRGLEIGDSFSIQLVECSESVTELKLEFGITTCDIEKITFHKSHVKSICVSDGRPCGGQSLTFKVMRSDAAIISFHRSRDAMDIIFEDGQFTQLKDPKRIFKNKTAFPFLMLTGSVKAVKIVDDFLVPAKKSLYHFSNQSKKEKKKNKCKTVKTQDETSAKQTDESDSELSQAESAVPDNHIPEIPIPIPTQATGSVKSGDFDSEEELETDVPDDLFFLSTLYPNETIQITGDSRIVRRASLFSGFVYFNRSLDVGEEIRLRVERVRNVHSDSSFGIGFSTCSMKSISTGEHHANQLCSRKSPCGGDSFLISIKELTSPFAVLIISKTEHSIAYGEDISNMVLKKLPPKFKNKSLHPFLMLSGTADTIRIIAKQREQFPPDEDEDAIQNDCDESHSENPQCDTPLSTAAPSATEGKIKISFQDLMRLHQQQQKQESATGSTSSDTTGPIRGSPIESVDGYPHLHENSNGEIVQTEGYPDFKNGFAHSVHQSSSPAVSAYQEPSTTDTDAEIVSSLSSSGEISSSSHRKWYNNPFVRFCDPFISRTGSGEETNYIFSSELLVNESIVFRISERESGVRSGSLHFGVTTMPTLQVDVCSLPADPADLRKRLDRSHWFLSSDLMKCVGIYDALTIRRTQSAVVLEMDEDSVTLIPHLPPDSVCPFFPHEGISAVRPVPASS